MNPPIKQPTTSLEIPRESRHARGSTVDLQPDPVPRDTPLMTRSDVAAVLRTTPRQISNMIARGQIPSPVRVAGLGLRWRRAEIDAWIAAQ